ncbi:cellulose biosynthesis protein BcsQ [Nocardioides aurantiacus]|uniref:Cellulose biosynthesis protein BcsQ n=1 Tax=Nocardioides aurantiacus TaxID=86796 RepID=A0A3N2CVM5_9ACTN|nr:cellulose biosynthesis protein BcsQ [Nocardioides aurantiacus]
MRDRVPVLVAAGGETWEAPALRALAEASVVVLKRCVDLTDLLASASAGTVGVVLVSGELAGLDADAVMQLLRVDVRCVAVGGDAEALGRLGVVEVHPVDDPAGLPDAVRRAVRQDLVLDPEPGPESRLEVRADRGRTVVVHGPAGAPGRTLLATGLAAEHARRGAPTVLVDADPHGGAVAQHLVVLDEVSGLLAAARLVNAGGLDARSFARCRREVTPGLEVLTGLPRPDRWVEARPGVLDAVLERASEVGDVVVDTGFSLEDDADLGRGLVRNQLTLDAVAAADHVVAVGSAEPVGLARLARTLVDLRDLAPVPVTVVVNRMRDSLGWSRRDILGMVEGYVRPAGVVFVPDDRAAADRALVAGRSVVEAGASPLASAVAELHEAVLGGAGQPVKRSSAGRGRWRCRRP